MDQNELAKIKQTIADLADSSGDLTERDLYSVFDMLLNWSATAYSISPGRITQISRAMDAVAFKAESTRESSTNEVVGFEVVGTRIGSHQIEQRIGGLVGSNSINRLVVFAPDGFTSDAIQLAHSTAPIDIELFDLARLRSWAENLVLREEELHVAEARLIVREFSRN